VNIKFSFAIRTSGSQQLRPPHSPREKVSEFKQYKANTSYVVLTRRKEKVESCWKCNAGKEMRKKFCVSWFCCKPCLLYDGSWVNRSQSYQCRPPRVLIF